MGVMDDEPVASATAPQQRPAHWFKPGQSGNPGGRPVASRNKITALFTEKLAADFEKSGAQAIIDAREADPVGYLRVIASLMPKDVHVSAQPLAELTEDELADAIATIQRYLAAGAPAIGAGETIEGEATRVVPALPEAAGVPCGGKELSGTPADGSKSGRQDAKRRR